MLGVKEREVKNDFQDIGLYSCVNDSMPLLPITRLGKSRGGAVLGGRRLRVLCLLYQF